MSATIVLIHGAASTAAIWGPLQRELALRGHRSLAPDLPGHGSNAHHPPGFYQAPQDLDEFATAPSALAGVGVDDYADHVEALVRRVAEHGPVLLAGTSAGGVPITAVAERVPELVDRLVYLSAWCAVASDSIGEYTAWPEREGNLFDRIPWPAVGDPARLGVGRINLRSSDPELVRAAKAAIMADGTDDEFRALIDVMEPDVNFRIGAEPRFATAARWGRVPRTFVRFTADESILPAEQDRMIAEADAWAPAQRFDVRSIDSSHAGYFCRPAEFADLLGELAAELG
ncbi:alpha/beta hydrolase [Saccharopolyspora gloriosae]|uniref:Pimeloyl-ACP methyl ester carboxylesterase n=1 Tax=Saccharopolyspora gloriosae TaxID=455344 RepID=A0A840NLK1_9PSEU|nr:alpha/beta fold hydrolase [Saccharopolyspora gloriosae]MBB5072444.1 pimeloyl-ACP methyl ester carboxylesterase [Saccharopolyspora gloriosae]